MSTETATALVDRIADLCQAYKSGEDGSRQGLIESCTKLLPQLMTPEETMVMTTWAQPTHNSVICLGVEMQLFEAMSKDGASPKSSGVIADSMTPPAEHTLISRMLRHMAAMGTVIETAPDTFAPTPYTQALTQEHYRDSIDFVHEDWQRIHLSTNDYFKQNNFKAPNTTIDGPFQLAYDCKGEHLFEYFGKHAPLLGKKFANVMKAWSTGRPKWFRTDYYPVQERLIDGAVSDDSATFLVDIGGGTGHDIMLFNEAFAGKFKGKLVFQDRPEIVAVAEKSLPPAVTAMAHDFMTPQVVQGMLLTLLASSLRPSTCVTD